MKAIAISVYVTIVFLFSAFARADVSIPFSQFAFKNSEASVVSVETVALDESTLDLIMTVRLPNPCFAPPTAEFLQNQEDPHVLVLRLTSPVNTEICIARTVRINTVVSLPIAAQTARLDLKRDSIYSIRIENYPIELRVSGEELQRVPGFIGQ